MTDLEAAAKAIHDLDQSMKGGPAARWEDQLDAYKEHGKARVRAVIEEIREGQSVVRCAVKCAEFEVFRPLNAVLDEVLRDRP